MDIFDADKVFHALVVMLAEPKSVLTSFLVLLAVVIVLTWWVTRRVMSYATWKGVASAIESALSPVMKAIEEHKSEDLRMWNDTSERYQRGMEMTSEKFTQGMELTSKYLQQVTKEQEFIRSKSDKTASDLSEIKGALKVLIPDHLQKNIFKEDT